MSAFYGTVRGAAASNATRRGHREIRAAVQSWAGSVVVTLYGDKDAPLVSIEVAQGSSAKGDRTIYDGLLSSLLDAGSLVAKIATDPAA